MSFLSFLLLEIKLMVMLASILINLEQMSERSKARRRRRAEDQ